jgi:DNA topoisomerase-2
MSKKIEETFKKLSDIDHCLLRPGMYIGSIKPNTSYKYILYDNKMTLKEITYNPGFIKLLDEIVTNSVDESKREGSKLNTIKVTVTDNKISVWDSGGIPVIKNKEHDEWIPEMVFSSLKSGSNFNDDENRTWAGTNGVGSSLTNIFSKEFKVSTCDGKNHFYQVFSNNMRDRTQPIIKKSKVNHTEITYIPDLEKFGLVNIDEDHLKMIEKRIYDIAACNPSLKIYFNGNLININSFEDYIKLYTTDYFFESNKDKTWSVGIAHSQNGFQQVSFVNSTETYDGGVHTDYVMNQIITHLREFFMKKHKVDIKPSELKSHIFLFLDSTIINPSFSSQTKEKLITEVKEFGSTFEVSNKLIQSILKSEIVNSILDWIQQKKNADDNKLQRELNKKLSKVKVEKLIDAKGKDRWKCSLSLFEGDCLEENTLVRVLRDGELLDQKIKNINIGDLVITHKNRYQEVIALTKKIEYKNIIKTSLGDIVCSNKHRFWVYDKEKNEFYFEHVYNIDKTKHKLVKNQLCFMDALLEIEKIYSDSILMKSGELFNVSSDHLLCVYNRLSDKFEMVEFNNINKIDYLIVNTFGL